MRGIDLCNPFDFEETLNDAIPNGTGLVYRKSLTEPRSLKATESLFIHDPEWSYGIDRLPPASVTDSEGMAFIGKINEDDAH
jgi:hypothetical protein